MNVKDVNDLLNFFFSVCTDGAERDNFMNLILEIQKREGRREGFELGFVDGLNEAEKKHNEAVKRA